MQRGSHISVCTLRCNRCGSLVLGESCRLCWNFGMALDQNLDLECSSHGATEMHSVSGA